MIYPKETTYEDLEKQVKEAGTAYEALTDLLVELSPYWYNRRVAGQEEAEPWADMRVLKETIDKLYIIRDTMTEKPLIMTKRPTCWNKGWYTVEQAAAEEEEEGGDKTQAEETKTEETKTEATKTEAKEA